MVAPGASLGVVFVVFVALRAGPHPRDLAAPRAPGAERRAALRAAPQVASPRCNASQGRAGESARYQPCRRRPSVRTFVQPAAQQEAAAAAAAVMRRLNKGLSQIFAAHVHLTRRLVHRHLPLLQLVVRNRQGGAGSSHAAVRGRGRAPRMLRGGSSRRLLGAIRVRQHRASHLHLHCTETARSVESGGVLSLPCSYEFSSFPRS